MDRDMGCCWTLLCPSKPHTEAVALSREVLMPLEGRAWVGNDKAPGSDCEKLVLQTGLLLSVPA